MLEIQVNQNEKTQAFFCKPKHGEFLYKFKET